MKTTEIFSEQEMLKIRESFHYLEKDFNGNTRLYFDNAGGSFRLKKAEAKFNEIDQIPDCSERHHKMALYLQSIEEKGKDDVRTIFNVEGGSIATSLTASQLMFQLVETVLRFSKGTNAVTSVLEHPSAYDATETFTTMYNKELRVAKSNKLTGGVDTQEVLSLIDEDTALLNIMYASNISGAIYDIPEIIKGAKKINPDIFIIIDAVQHTPHAVMDFSELEVDAVTFAPYKYFGTRGIGVGYVSDRLSKLQHNKLLGKDKLDWELGSPAPAQYAMITEIVNYVCSLSDGKKDASRREQFANGMNRIALHERALLEALLDGTENNKGLRDMNNVNVLMDGKDLSKRDLILGIGFDNIEYSDAVREYEKRDVIVYERVVSSLYSVRMLKSFDLEGAVRISPLHCNNFDDIDRFLSVTQEISQL